MSWTRREASPLVPRENRRGQRVALRPREVDQRTRRFPDRADLVVADDPDDLVRLAVRAEQMHAAADRIEAGPVFTGHGFIDDGHSRRGFGVARIEVPPGEEWYAERFEIAGADPRDINQVAHRLALVQTVPR